MTSFKQKSPQPLTYPSRSIKRAERSLACAPFNLKLWEKMSQESVAVNAIAGNLGVQNGYTKRYLSELVAENHLLWLIQIGVLRREVDGQGITDGFRLTPLGRQLVEQYQTGHHSVNISWRDRFNYAWERWFRLPL